MEVDLVEKLRRENPEQFLVLVRMHLSFIVDMNTDENDTSPTDKPKSFKWTFTKKPKSGEGNPKNVGPVKNVEVFNLSEGNIDQIYQLIQVLELEDNVCQEGIFRRTGSLSRQQQLRKLLSAGKSIMSDDDSENECSFSVHDMASVLKGILADTPEPLLLNQHYQAYCHLASTCFNEGQIIAGSETRLTGALRLLLLLLPALSWHVAKRLLSLLHKVTTYESSNRMSPSALATMFAPHLVCPRRITPESLHTDSQMLAPILTYMITYAFDMFVPPPQLLTDISAYFSKKEQKRLLSPTGEDLNESVTERTAASTVFTFVDRQMSGTGETVNQNNKTTYNNTFTDTALAQLYAHIQALPESQNKRRLIKQFNRENGNGTPLQIQRAQKQKSLGQSLKKHIFNKSLMSKTMKRSAIMQDQGFGYQSIMESPTVAKSQPKIELIEMDNLSGRRNIFEDAPKDDRADPRRNESGDQVGKVTNCPATPLIIRRKLEVDQLLTSTPHVSANCDTLSGCSTPINNIRRSSMSPITKSTQKMPKAMQESIMTPRSRKPVVISCDPPMPSQPSAQEVLPPNNSPKSSNQNDSTSSSLLIKNDSDFVSTDESCPSKSYCIKYKRFTEDAEFKQPPSSESSTCDSSSDFICRKDRKTRSAQYDLNESEIVEDKLNKRSNRSPDKSETSLTDPFKNYLLCRSILTKSPVDLSFATDSEDFIDVENVSANKMTDSLLYCLDGNRPDRSRDSDKECLLGNESVNEKENNNRNLKRSFDELQSYPKTFKCIAGKENMEPFVKNYAQNSDEYAEIKKSFGKVDDGDWSNGKFVENNDLSNSWRPLRETNL